MKDAAKSVARTPEVQRFWEAVKRLPTYVKLAAAIIRDPEVPKSTKALLGVGGAYAVSPIDLVPGVIPVAGQMDDMYVLLFGLQQTLRRMDPQVAARHLDAFGLTTAHIDEDLNSVIALAKTAVVSSVKAGGKAVGRTGKAGIDIVREFVGGFRENRSAAKNAKAQSPAPWGQRTIASTGESAPDEPAVD